MKTEAVEREYRKEKAAEEHRKAVVARLERSAEQSPRLYAAKVSVVLLLGWLYLGFLAALGVLLILISGGSPILIILGAALLIVLISALQLPKLNEWNGIVLKRQDFPVFYGELDELARRFKTKPIHSIAVHYTAAASASELPRSGVLGGFERQMTLGLPLLMALTPQEMRSVLCHEMGHFSGKHGRSGYRIYMIQIIWRRLRDQAATKSRGFNRSLIVPFADWYQNILGAHASALGRRQEVEADNRAFEVCGKDSGMALLRARVLQTKLDEMYASIQDFPILEELPPASFSELLANAICNPLPVDRMESAIGFALSMKQDLSSVHPAMSERLKRFGIDLNADLDYGELNGRPAQTAAEVFLGAGSAKLYEEINKVWAKDGESWWVEQRNESLRFSEELEKIRNTPKTTVDHYLQEAYLVEQVEGLIHSLPYYAKVLEMWPDNPRVMINYGLVLLRSRMEEGVSLVEQAMDQCPQYIQAGCEDLCNFYAFRGDYEKYSSTLERLNRLEVAKGISRKESTHHFEGNIYMPHGLSAREIDRIVESVSNQGGMRELYVVRKELADSGLGNKLIAVIVLDPNYYQWKITRTRPEIELRDRILPIIAMPEDFVLYVQSKKSSLVAAVQSVPGSRIALKSGKP